MRRRDAVTVVAGVAAVGASVFALGGGARWAQSLVAFLVAIALAPQLLSRRALARVSPLVAVLAAAVTLTAIQLLPLPASVVELVNPVGSSLREDGAALLDLEPWSSLSLDPPRTLGALCFFVILLGVGSVALRFAASERGRYRMLAAIALLCGATALTVGVHEVFGATDLYFVYQLNQAHPSVLGPLLNENHLGCLMALGTVVSLGLVMYRRQRSWMRAGWLVVAAACGATTAASQSRGAVLALVAGCVVTGGILAAQRFAVNVSRARRPSMMVSALPIAVVAACAVVVMIYASAGGVSDQLSRTTMTEVDAPMSKFVAWKSAQTLIGESPWVGIGRGALEPAFTRVHPASSFATYAYVENEFVQAVVDWGIPGALVIGLAGLWLIGVAIRRWSDGPLAAGALGALGVVLIQSNVDFGVELLGVAVPITVVVATLTYVPLVETTGSVLRARALRGLHIAALGVAGAILLTPATTTLDEDHVALRSLRAPTLADIRVDLNRHPLDYYGYALAAEAMMREGDQRAARLLNHAMLLHPTHTGLHRMAGLLLLRSGRVDQAAIEFAAVLRGTLEPRRVLEEILAVFPKELAATAIPADYPAITTIIIPLQELNRLDVAIPWLGRVLDHRPNSMEACELLYSLALAARDLTAIDSAIRRCTSFEPSHESRLQLAQITMEQQRHRDVIALLKDVESWQGLIAEKSAAWLLLCDAHAGLHHWDEARRCLRRLDASGIISDKRDVEIVKRLDQISSDRRQSDLQRAP